MSTEPTVSPLAESESALRARVLGIESGHPSIDSPVYATKNDGVPYLRTPGVALLARPQVSLEAMQGFLSGFAPELDFPQYIFDPVPLTPAAQLVKTAGQICYASFSPKRSWNKDADRYFENIKASQHGSVAEHATFSFLIWGVSRSLTLELNRHRHLNISQLSQRYVSGKVLRFVERPEYVEDAMLHQAFEDRIEYAAEAYNGLSERLLAMQGEGAQLLTGEAKTDLRKKVQQAARSALPNETETFGVWSGNVRALRHVIEMRASAHAEVEIRLLGVYLYLLLSAVEPTLFSDYRLIRLKDGTWAVETDYRKI